MISSPSALGSRICDCIQVLSAYMDLSMTNVPFKQNVDSEHTISLTVKHTMLVGYASLSYPSIIALHTYVNERL